MRTVVLTVGLLLLLVAPARAETTQRNFLRGLEGFFVTVDAPGDDAKEAGLDEDVIKTAVELKLRKNGVPVFELAERKNEIPLNLRALLTVRVKITKPKGATAKFSAYTTTIVLMQPAKLDRDPNIPVWAATWELEMGLGIGEQSDIRKQIDDGVDKFANDWLATHPKKP